MRGLVDHSAPQQYPFLYSRLKQRQMKIGNCLLMQIGPQISRIAIASWSHGWSIAHTSHPRPPSPKNHSMRHSDPDWKEPSTLITRLPFPYAEISEETSIHQVQVQQIGQIQLRIRPLPQQHGLLSHGHCLRPGCALRKDILTPFFFQALTIHTYSPILMVVT